MKYNLLEGGSIVFLAKNYSKKTGRTYLQIVHGYRDKEGKTKRVSSEAYLIILLLETHYIQ